MGLNDKIFLAKIDCCEKKITKADPKQGNKVKKPGWKVFLSKKNTVTTIIPIPKKENNSHRKGLIFFSDLKKAKNDPNASSQTLAKGKKKFA